MPVLHRSLLAFALAAAPLAAVVAPRTASAGPACPTNEMDLGGTGAFTSGAAAFDSSLINAYGGEFRVSYDLVAGMVSMYQCCNLPTTYVQASDAYDVTGVSLGTPVAVTVEFAVDGAVFTGGCGGSGCSGTYGANVRHGAEVDEVIHSEHLFNGRLEFQDILSQPITIVAGQPEQVDFKIWGHRNPGGSHGSEATGHIRFTGLEPGISMVSCQGFGGQPVPVRASTWGRIKAIYR